MIIRERISWPKVWMSVAHNIAQSRSHDPRLQVCAIIVPEDNSGILALGYNGNYSNGPNHVDSSEPGQSGCIHAEQNALVKCPYHYHMKKHMYVTHSPCPSCAKLIINGQISKVIYDVEYRDLSGVELLKSSGIEIIQLKDA